MSMIKSKMLNVLILFSFVLQPLYSKNTFADPIPGLPGKGGTYLHNEKVYTVKKSNDTGTKTKYSRKQTKAYNKLKDIKEVSGVTASDTDVDGKTVIKEVSPDGSTSTRTKYVKISPEDNLDRINKLCDGGDLENLAEQNAQDLEDKEANIAAQQKEVDALKAKELEALNAMKDGCHSACVHLGLGLDGLGQAGKDCKVDLNVLCPRLQASDLDDPYVKAIIQPVVQGGKTPACSEEALKNPLFPSPRAACEAVLKMKDGAELSTCVKSARDNGGMACDAFGDWLIAREKLDKATNVLAQLKKARDNNYKNASCNKIDSTRDYSSYHPDCLSKLAGTCDRAMADAALILENQYKGGAGGYCATCDVYGSKGMAAASIIGALGGIAVPLGLGGMQFASNKNLIGQYSNLYMQQLQTCAAVGIPCPPPSFAGMGINNNFMAGGIGGAIGGGFGGMYGGAAMGGMSMGMPGMIASANLFMSPQGYNPYMNQNAMIQPQGYYPGSMYPGANMMQPNMMQGNMNMMDVQHQMYANQLRMAEMSGQLYAANQGGIYGGGMGMGYPQQYPGMYGGAIGSAIGSAIGGGGYSGMYGGMSYGGMSYGGAQTGMFASANLFTSPSTYYPPFYGSQTNTGYPSVYPSSGCGGGTYPAIGCGNQAPMCGGLQGCW